MKIECPYCGGLLIWDYKSGDIVCSSCGLVIDKIVEYRLCKHTIKDEEVAKKTRMQKNPNKVPRTYRIYKNIFNEMKSCHKSLEVDSKAFTEYAMGMRGHVRIFITERTVKALSYLEKDQEVKYILDNVIRKIPILNSRTDRARIAAALIIKTLIKKRKLGTNEFKRVSEATGISVSHARRLYAIIRRKFDINRVIKVKSYASSGLNKNRVQK